MHHHFLRILISLSISLILFSCEEESQSSEAQKVVEGEYTEADTTTSSIDLATDQETGQPQIYGRWKIISKYVGELILSEADLGEATTEFTTGGEMIRSTPDLGSQATSYTLEADKIKSIQEGEFNIIRLTVDTLILTQVVDQEVIKETYTRIP